MAKNNYRTTAAGYIDTTPTSQNFQEEETYHEPSFYNVGTRFQSSDRNTLEAILDSHPTLEEYKNYTLDNKGYLNDIDNYIDNHLENRQLNIGSNIELINYIEYLHNMDKFDYQYYLYFLRYVKDLVSRKLLHQNNAQEYFSCLASFDSQVKQKPLSMSLSASKVIIYSNYIEKNWRLVSNHVVIDTIHKMGGYIGLSSKSKISIRFSEKGQLREISYKEAEKLISIKTGLDVKIIEKRRDKVTDFILNEDGTMEPLVSHSPIILSIYDLMYLEGEKFRPYMLKEYYKEDEEYFRNLFVPTKYMKLVAGEYKEPTAIISLIYNLVGHDEYRFKYVINWLSSFFQTLKKSQVALVLLGDQGSGKGILFNDVISALFGLLHCTEINDSTLGSRYKAQTISNRLFYNIDESNNTGSSSIRNFIKTLITSNTTIQEAKGENIKDGIEIHGQLLITSNDSNPVEIEKNDRRFTVFTTGRNIALINFLGYGSYDTLIATIKDELEDFAIYLKSYDVDYKLANTALDTAEKSAIINVCSDKFQSFADSIEAMRIEDFQDLKEINATLFYTLIIDFTNKRIDRASLPKIYKALYSGPKNNLSRNELHARLRLAKPHIFNDDNIKSLHGKKYFLL